MHLDQIRNMHLPPIEQQYGHRDTILYALGLGYGTDPMDESELPFVYEQSLQSVPSMVSVLSHPGFWLQDPRYGVDWVKVLHAEQSFSVFAPIPTAGSVRGDYRTIGVEDKGAARGAMLHMEKTLFDSSSNTRLATVRSSVLLRGDGGQGAFGDTVEPAMPIPQRAPDRVLEFVTLPSAALIYRLSGDYNPLHADPQVARSAGFTRPILHGLCSFGVGCRALLKAYCDNQPARLASMFARFSAPVYPGETLRFEFHELDSGLRFKAVAKDRGVVVLDRCSAQISS